MAKRHPVTRLFGVYVLVELAVLIALVYAVGFGWTILLLVATFALGLAVAGSQLTRQLARLRTGLASPQAAATDAMLIALGTVLTVVPGLVTSLLGVVLLLPPTRAIARPAVVALAARSLGRIPVVVAAPGGFPPRRGDYVDGDVIDGEVIDVNDAPGTTDEVALEPRRLPPPTQF